MSLIENIISQISSTASSGITNPLGVDLNDDTFAKLLEQQGLALKKNETESLNILGELGMPAGFMIEPIDGIEFTETIQDQLESIGENKITNQIEHEPFVMKDLDLGDYFSSLLKSENENTSFMNFARKNATNAYNNFGKNFVADLTEFVDDIKSTI